MVKSFIPGDTKPFIRKELELHLLKHNVKKVLTLPGLNFELETSLLNKGVEVSCIEKYLDIYTEQLLIVPKKCKLYNIEFKDLPNLSDYDGMFLDFCGFICKSFSEKTLEIKKGTQLGITFSLDRRNDWSTIRMGPNKIQSHIDILHHLSIKTISYLEYKDLKTNMLFIIAEKY